MTKRHNYREPIPRCQAITLRKKRCALDATFIHRGSAYCPRRYELIMKKLVTIAEIDEKIKENQKRLEEHLLRRLYP